MSIIYISLHTIHVASFNENTFIFSVIQMTFHFSYVFDISTKIIPVLSER